MKPYEAGSPENFAAAAALKKFCEEGFTMKEEAPRGCDRCAQPAVYVGVGQFTGLTLCRTHWLEPFNDDPGVMESALRCDRCGHREDDHGDDQECDLDGRPTGPVYLVCYRCVEEDEASPAGYSHWFESSVPSALTD